MSEQDPAEKQELKEARKRASQVGLFLGGLAFVLGALACLVYLLIYKPWKFH